MTFTTTQHAVQVPATPQTGDRTTLLSVQVTRMNCAAWVWVGPPGEAVEAAYAPAAPVTQEEDDLEKELRAALKAAGRDKPVVHQTFGTPLPGSGGSASDAGVSAPTSAPAGALGTDFAMSLGTVSSEVLHSGGPRLAKEMAQRIARKAGLGQVYLSLDTPSLVPSATDVRPDYTQYVLEKALVQILAA